MQQVLASGPIILLLLNASAILSAAVVDFFNRKIPNIHVAVMATCALVYVFVYSRDAWFLHLLSGVYVSCVVIVLFKRKFLGGGDAKMLAALALWFLPQQLTLFVLWTMICGGVLGSLYLAMILLGLACEKFLPRFKLPKIDPKFGMPYGVAVACGFAIAALRVF